MKLHLGCGQRFIPGWYHIDVVNFSHIDLQHEINRLPMISDGSVDEIYACHVLEHFQRGEVVGVLEEWHRVLKNDGRLRVAVPDFAAVCAEYSFNRDLNPLLGLLVGRQDGLYNYHHAIFDESLLRNSLASAGFSAIKRYDWRKTEHAHIDDFSQAYLPHMDKTNGRLVSLNMEGTKCQEP